ncbi:hypothetical protein CRG98_024792 [Punica granatum]|uniref:Uncharacterized protein n=1 Tax=Punica granatum TaxID=22663 RepID=A0A2I0JF13_PUNGR|nr:hypothetical protein CRG98_024792 [Punica granatum]
MTGVFYLAAYSHGTLWFGDPYLRHVHLSYWELGGRLVRDLVSTFGKSRGYPILGLSLVGWMPNLLGLLARLRTPLYQPLVPGMSCGPINGCRKRSSKIYFGFLYHYGVAMIGLFGTPQGLGCTLSNRGMSCCFNTLMTNIQAPLLSLLITHSGNNFGLSIYFPKSKCSYGEAFHMLCRFASSYLVESLPTVST